MEILFQIDPINKLNLAVDTSIALAKEAHKRGYNIYYNTPNDIRLNGDQVTAHITKLTFNDDHLVQQDYHIKNLADFDIIFIRQDPPFDINYVTNCHILSLVKGPLFVNNPQAILTHSEKIYAHEFAEFMPKTLVSSNINYLIEFLNEQHNAVIKPINLCGGQGVTLVSKDDSHARDKITALLNAVKTPIIIQQFLPDVAKGDTRVIICGGKVIGQVLRIPPVNKITSNLCGGGHEAGTTLSEMQLHISNKIALDADNKGLFLVGADFIGNYLTEINVTSPTGIVHASRQMDTNLSSIIWNSLITKYQNRKSN